MTAPHGSEERLSARASESGAAALTFREVSKSFSARPEPLRAVTDLSVEVRAGRIVGLAGPDGAGKTTVLRLAAGLLAPDRGDIRVAGRDMVREPLAAQSELGYMPQQFGLYVDLTVRENLVLYADLRGQPLDQRSARYDELMKMTGMRPFMDRLAGNLSGGMQQKLGLACVLVRAPRLLLLDEPTAGVDPVSRRELWAILYRLVADEQTGVLLSTGYLDEAARCDEVLVLDGGNMLARGTPEELTRQVEGRTCSVSAPEHVPRDLQARLTGRAGVVDAVVEAGRVRVVLAPEASADLQMLLPGVDDAHCEEVPPRLENGVVAVLHAHRHDKGRESSAAADTPQRAEGGASEPGRSAPAGRRRARANGDGVAIGVKNLKRRFGDFYAVKGLEFQVARGEVFGLLGANGAGKSTTFRMLCGLLPPSDGTLQVAGVDMRRAPAHARSQIGYMSQTFSLYGNLTVMENLRFFSSAYGLTGKHRRQRLAWALQEFELESWKRHASGALPLGYRQRLALAAALIHQPQIVFLDEPTSGVDPLARREFWQRIAGQAAAGVTVMVTTHFMEEAEYCDRLAIMMAGELLTLGSPADIRASAKTSENPEPTVEDAFIHLIESRDEGSSGEE